MLFKQEFQTLDEKAAAKGGRANAYQLPAKKLDYL
tara:strand:+ start:372 stop:476 length:105 start_codon:yes stop_codon:yes gene_type:complete